MKVYQSLKLSYDYLESYDVRFFFLLCSLFEEYSDICPEELLSMEWGWPSFWKFKIQNKQEKGCHLLETLKDSFLLYQGSLEVYAKNA